MINVASCFTIDKAHGRGKFPKSGVKLGNCLILGHFFENASTLGLYLTHKSFKIFGRYLVFIMNMHQSNGS
jgi:hypothetical protein